MYFQLNIYTHERIKRCSKHKSSELQIWCRVRQVLHTNVVAHCVLHFISSFFQTNAGDVVAL